MRATEILRGILDIIDDIDNSSTEVVDSEENPTAADFYDDQARRMNQIKDLLPKEGDEGQYANSPAEACASIEAVTTDAGGGWMAPKHPADIRADSVAMYPGAQHVS